MLAYDFGPQHPLRPQRLLRTIELVERMIPQMPVIDPGTGDVADVARVHDPEFIATIRKVSSGKRVDDETLQNAGVKGGDTPVFPGMYEAALAYCAGTAAAARDVAEGAAIAFNIAGGLHHARRAQASGFCVFNDPAIAISILREKFERVAYVDIDVHHGDGVQWIFLDDSNVLTCSIHETGFALYPGTGFVKEHGAHRTSVNVPLEPLTTGDVWLDAFERGILQALHTFKPEAVVLQMGTDAHYLDPLAHLQVSAKQWCRAIEMVRDFDAPIVAVGGGGYCATTVPRMWTAAILTLMRIEIPHAIPSPYDVDWDMPTFFDPIEPGGGTGKEFAEETLLELQESVLSKMVAQK